VWSDDNGDGRLDAGEVQFLKPAATGRSGLLVGGVGVGNDLSFTIANAGNVALRLAPTRISAHGVPDYAIQGGEILARDVQPPASSGGGQVLVGNDGWTVLTTPPAPFAAQGVGGARNGVPMWSYPSLWPGLHASHIAPLPEFPGELIGTTRVLGNPVDAPSPSNAGQLWAINGNEGQIYLFTIDGLFVATLFRDARTQPEPLPPRGIRGADFASTSLLPECFHPVLTETADGKVYLQAGHTGSLFRLYGLDGIRRLPDATITVTSRQLADAQRQAVLDELARTATTTLHPGVLEVERVTDDRITARTNGPDWPDDATRWVNIDTRNILVGSWARRQVDTDAALAIARDRLLIAVRTDDPALLENSGDALQNLFKTGGGIDLMLGTDATAAPDRAHAVKGDERLLVARVQGRTTAILYRPVEPGSTADSATFSSPLRTIRFDQVIDVSDQVELTQDADVNGAGGTKRFIYRLSVPLRTLRLAAPAGASLKGDIGVLRGNGIETLQRAYWSNKATGLVSDVPSEAELTPNLWGTFHFGR
ncbi:NHL repeat containing protein, partial [Burkholderia sp. TJI49]